MEGITIAKKVELAIHEQGRKKTWLADQLGITRPTLDRRLKDNSFTDYEISLLQTLSVV